MRPNLTVNHRFYGLLTGVVISAIVVALTPTFAAMLRIWAESDTFNHCFLIAPTSAYLIWRRRKQLAAIEPTPSLAGLAAVTITSGAWLLGDLASTVIVQNFAAVGLIPLSIWAVLGTRTVREIMFPLGYLFFMVPIGYFLVPPLMEYTADFAVITARASGVPVYRDGLFFTIPGGSFKIVEACSGIRMVIAALAIGTLFAYLNFRAWAHRLIFIVSSAGLAILANGIRAYAIVMIGHYQGMEAVVDHILLGYGVFAAAIVLILLIGSYFSDEGTADESTAGENSEADATAGPGSSLIMAGIIVAIVTTTPYITANIKARSSGIRTTPLLELPSAADGWTGPESFDADWSPQFVGQTSTRFGRYRQHDNSVDFYAISYLSQTEGAELINEKNRLFDGRAWMLIRDESGSAMTSGGDSIDYREIEIHSFATAKRLVRYWYVVDDHPQLSRFVIKLQELGGALTGKPMSGGVIAISTRVSIDSAAASQILDEFMISTLR